MLGADSDQGTPCGVRLLGDIEIVGGSDREVLTRDKERGLLAVLALHSATTVSSATLIDTLWGTPRRVPPQRPCRGTSNACESR